MGKLWHSLTEFVEASLGMPGDLFTKIALTLAAVCGCLLFRAIVVRLATKKIRDVSKKYIANKAISYFLWLLVLIALIRIWLGGVAGLATYLGLVSAGVAIALQDPLSNLAGWFYIVAAKPFVTGDRVQIQERAGDVIDISLFQFTLNEIGNWATADQSTGRIVRVPNNWVFKHSCFNYTQGFNFVWNELPVTITFESNWQKAKEILSRIANEHSAIKSEHAASEVRKAAGKFMIFYEKLSPIVWTSVADFGVTLTVRYLCQPRRRRISAERMWEEILKEFARCDDIDFAYPTRRIYNNVMEGKPGAKAGARQEGPTARQA
jgi:small-conductance mechanosensitive channel